MQYNTCLFCKRCMEQFCYSIYDPDNQPYLNIVQLFGDVEENLRHGRYICHECLYIIRWIYFMKKILADALMDDDIGENAKVIPAFNIFRVKMNQPIFVLAEDGSSDDDGDEVIHMPSSHVQYIQSTEPENACNVPTELSNHVYFNGDFGGHQQPLENGTFISSEVHLQSLHSAEYGLIDCNSNSSQERQSPDLQDEVIAGQTENPGENRLKQYSCTIKVCEHKCDTFEELRKHYQHHHLIEQSELTVESYDRQMLEFSKSHSCTSLNPRRKKFRCLLSHCKKTFKTNECLSEHKVKEHDLMAKFWCDECYNLPFVTWDDLHQHTLIFHSHNNITQRTNEYPCKYCDKYFLEKNLLSAHQLKHHNLQFLKQSEAKQQIRTSIVKKQMYRKQKPSNLCNQTSTKRICSFKMRVQKEVLSNRRKQDVFLKWLKVKFPKFNPKPVANMKIHSFTKNEPEKVLISLPPRKRRQYQAANDIENAKQTDCVHDKVVESVSVDCNTWLTMERNESVPNVTKESQHSLQVLDALENVVSTSTTPSNMINSTHLSLNQAKLPSVGNCLESILKNTEVPTAANRFENPEEKIKCLDNVDDTLKPFDKQNKINDLVTQENINLFKNCMEVPKDTGKIAPLKAPEIKINLPLKTYNSRKRKRPHQNLAKRDSTYLKKPSESIENLTETSPELEMPILQNATKEEQAGKLQSLPPVLPPVIEEKLSDNNPPGRITMKISLKAIKQYANNKEGKREGKRKRKLKGKKKSKTLPQPEIQKPASPVISQSQEDMLPNSNEVIERKSKRLNHIHLPAPMIIDSGKCSLKLQKDHQNNATPAEYSHTSRDISESENENRNEFTLNKDEINMIIFGETLNCSNLNSGISLINEQIIDINDEQVSTSFSNNEQLVDSNSISLAKSPKKKSKPKSRITKKRKTKRKTDKTLKLSLDADGTVIDRNQIHQPECIQIDTDAEETVEGQIANIKLKDHLYARSAFNAFKHSKWEPSE